MGSRVLVACFTIVTVHVCHFVRNVNGSWGADPDAADFEQQCTNGKIHLLTPTGARPGERSKEIVCICTDTSTCMGPHCRPIARKGRPSSDHNQPNPHTNPQTGYNVHRCRDCKCVNADVKPSQPTRQHDPTTRGHTAGDDHAAGSSSESDIQSSRLSLRPKPLRCHPGLRPGYFDWTFSALNPPMLHTAASKDDLPPWQLMSPIAGSVEDVLQDRRADACMMHDIASALRRGDMLPAILRDKTYVMAGDSLDRNLVLHMCEASTAARLSEWGPNHKICYFPRNNVTFLSFWIFGLIEENVDKSRLPQPFHWSMLSAFWAQEGSKTAAEAELAWLEGNVTETRGLSTAARLTLVLHAYIQALNHRHADDPTNHHAVAKPALISVNACFWDLMRIAGDNVFDKTLDAEDVRDRPHGESECSAWNCTCLGLQQHRVAHPGIAPEWWTAMMCDVRLDPRLRKRVGGAGCSEYACDPIPPMFLARRARNIRSLGHSLRAFWAPAETVTLWKLGTRMQELSMTVYNLTARAEQYNLRKNGIGPDKLRELPLTNRQVAALNAAAIAATTTHAPAHDVAVADARSRWPFDGVVDVFNMVTGYEYMTEDGVHYPQGMSIAMANLVLNEYLDALT